MVEHYALQETNPDKPYKQKCNCGRWFYDLHVHLECVEKGCHPEQWHSNDPEVQKRLDAFRERGYM